MQLLIQSQALLKLLFNATVTRTTNNSERRLVDGKLELTYTKVRPPVALKFPLKKELLSPFEI